MRKNTKSILPLAFSEQTIKFQIMFLSCMSGKKGGRKRVLLTLSIRHVYQEKKHALSCSSVTRLVKYNSLSDKGSSAALFINPISLYCFTSRHRMTFQQRLEAIMFYYHQHALPRKLQIIFL